MQPSQPTQDTHEVEVKNLRLERETEYLRLERLKKVLQARMALGKTPEAEGRTS
jgi:hypothetical protein